MEPRLSVVIPTRDRPELLRAALDSLARYGRAEDEVIVVDSASRDPHVFEIARRAGVRTIRLERPGTSRARNAGLAASHAPLVAFIDDDCLVSETWASEIERAFTNDRMGFLTGKVEADHETRAPVSVVTGNEPKWFDGNEDFSRLGGSVNIAFRREALEAIGGFDEGMGPATPIRAAEDHDVIWRLLRGGWAGRYEPSIVVIHQQWRSSRQAIRREFAYGIGAGALAVKMIRSSDPRGWKTLRARLWEDGVASSGRNLMRGYESGAAGAALKAVGVLVGVVRARRIPIVDGHFRS